MENAIIGDPGLVRVQAGQQGRPRGAAAGRIVGLGEAQAAAGEPVDVWSPDLAAEGARVRVAHVIYENHDDIRPGLSPDAHPWQQEESESRD